MVIGTKPMCGLPLAVGALLVGPSSQQTKAYLRNDNGVTQCLQTWYYLRLTQLYGGWTVFKPKYTAYHLPPPNFSVTVFYVIYKCCAQIQQT